MRFGLFYEHQLPRPWTDGLEQKLFQDALGGRPESAPLIMRVVNRLIYWPLPAWVFTTGYVAVFAYAAALLWLAPPRPWRGALQTETLPTHGRNLTPPG